ncbi:hypothetical protein C1I98_12715 [Spongiactinospora gelatinilytica]|uniref:Uncharacterized protein n=1 Tax=Spongiactinospora gelatinilytica TaxID=2666298 RepID=A0A2W2GJR5_9ACTN|nr:hypothetical protein C1I98_12715 [Spongiactinospora gelatinilytica]
MVGGREGRAMARGDWTIVGRVAIRYANGRQVVVAAGGRFKSLDEAIGHWERQEAERRNRELAELGHVVNTAFKRMERACRRLNEIKFETGDLV